MYRTKKRRIAYSLVFLIVLLLTSITSFQLGNSLVPSAGTYYLDVPFAVFNYYVGQFDNGSTYMINSDTWKLECYSDSDPTSIINFALGNLTSGRVWTEKVVIKGNYTGLEKILIPSYTVLELIGRLQAKTNLNDHLIENNDTTNGNTDIEIFGGIIDGNGDSQTADMNTIHFKKVSNSSVHDIHVLGGGRHSSTNGEGIEFDACTYSDIYSCKVETYKYTYDPIKLTASSYCTIDGNTLIQNAGNNHGSGAIQLATSSFENVVSNNVIYANGGNGIKMHTSHRNVISGNQVTGAGGDMISMIVGSDENLIIGNTLLYPSGFNGWGAITIRNSGTASDNVIKSNYIKLKDSSLSRGIVLDENSLRTRLIGNTIIGNGAGVTGIVILTDATDTYLKDNDLSDSALTTPLIDNGTNTVWIDKISPYEQYIPLCYRIDNYGLVYYDDPYIIIRVMNETGTRFISWLAFGDTFSYGIYEWKAKAENNGTNVSPIYMGLERHMGWYQEGSIAFLWWGGNWECLTSHSGADTVTNIDEIDFTVERTFMINWTSSYCEFYIDGVLKANHTTNIPQYPMQLNAEIGTQGYTTEGEPTLYWRNRSFKEIG